MSKPKIPESGVVLRRPNLVIGDSWPAHFSINASASLPGWNQSPNLRREKPFASLGIQNGETRLKNRIAAADIFKTLNLIEILPAKLLDRKQPQNP